ncbi:helix-turn-helix domain-containing protein [Paenibacillus sp. MMS20-IR301]|uniref:helix-turn-helix domain-containing protein n=1 Tax=Paenibacillus sp. MMS20-IR301 TaxID=2895946 RepID=UPI0028EDBB5D|nr:helix-turn-helix domain-containing protein [Paenibacillus sp. MMS20-IR301]WNS45820.1 helix-turn-helix domain-containing protein [Paenibacillus sp. MMS20-IR301]
MSHLDHLQKTINYIEEHLKETVTIDECARVAGFSKFHFHRLFSLMAGYTVMEYIRKRRLCHAMVDILNGRRVLDVALDYGYSSERTFSRAFQQEFGQVPSRCRNGRYSIPAKLVLADILNPFHGGFTMEYLSEVRIEQLNSMTVASASRVSDNPEEDVMMYLDQWAETAGIRGNRNFGFDIPVTEEEQQRGLRGYEYWYALNERIQTPEDITVKDVQSCKYAVLRITEPFIDPFERIPLGWNKLVSWVNSKGYETSCEQERYWPEEVLVIDGVTFMDLYFPIE